MDKFYFTQQIVGYCPFLNTGDVWVGIVSCNFRCVHLSYSFYSLQREIEFLGHFLEEVYFRMR